MIHVLEALKETRALPKMIRLDNGPEFVSQKLDAWCPHGVELHHIQPGNPTQNAYVERFNGKMRRELLDANVFFTLDQIRARVAERDTTLTTSALTKHSATGR